MNKIEKAKKESKKGKRIKKNKSINGEKKKK